MTKILTKSDKILENVGLDEIQDIEQLLFKTNNELVNDISYYAT